MQNKQWHRTDKRGFTIAELVIVLAVLAIVSVMVTVFVVLVNNWVLISTQRYNATLSQSTAETALKNFVESYDSSDYLFTTELSKYDESLFTASNGGTGKNTAAKASSIFKDIASVPRENEALYVYDDASDNATCVGFLLFNRAAAYATDTDEQDEDEDVSLDADKTVSTLVIAKKDFTADETTYLYGVYPLDYITRFRCSLYSMASGKQLAIANITYIIDYSNSKIDQTDTATIAVAIHAQHADSTSSSSSQTASGDEQ